MRPVPAELLHFSEDPTITRFAPHVAATAADPDPYVWAVDAEQSPSYWFPRQCPRAMAWIGPRTTVEDRERVLGPGGVVPLGPPAPVGDLFALHAAAGIQLRVLPGIRAFFDGLVAGSMEFSGIRLRNADCRRT